jgi:glycosyltransferase involved in cell wall biosynthesis
MHILLIHQAFAALNEPGGTRHDEFAHYLAAHGHRVTVIASPVSYLTGSTLPPDPVNYLPGSALPPDPSLTSQEKNEGVTVLRARVYSAHHKSFFHRFLAFISFMSSSFFLGLGVKDVDLVWGTSPQIFQGVTAWALARLKGVPFLFEVRDLWPKFAIAVGVLRNRILIRLSLWLERFLYRHADRVMVNSPGFVAHVTERGVPGERIELVPNGADPEMFDPADHGDAFRSRHGLVDHFVVLYAGAHGMSNDLDAVLEAANSLAGDRPEVRIVFLGDGKEKPALQEQAKILRLTNVLFLPPIPKTKMPAALAGANACLAILKPIEAYKTTYPNKVFDYMAAGRPVVLAIDGVIREVVEAAGCGIFARPGDPAAVANAIRKLASDPESSRRMGLAGRKYLKEHFSREAIASMLMGILEEMVK